MAVEQAVTKGTGSNTKKDFGLESRIQITDKFKAILNSMFK